jgi:protein-tyrosine phosphatase
LQLQRPSPVMVSSSSGPSPFGLSGGAGGGASSTPGHSLAAADGAQQAPPQPAPRTAPIRPNALINFNCIAQSPTIPNNLASPMQTMMMMSRNSRSASATGPTRPTCCPMMTTTTTTSGETNAATNNNYSCNHQSKALSPSGLNDSLPSQIMPHLYVGNQEQTNRETVNKLNIKYILSLGLLPMIMINNNNFTSVTSISPVSPSSKKASSKQRDSNHSYQTLHHHHHHHHHNHHHHHHQHSSPNHQPQNLMPTQNSSRDFKIRIRSNTPTTPTTPNPANTANTFPTATTTTTTTTHPPSVESSGCLSSSNQNSISSTTAIPNKTRDENKGIKQVRSVYCKCINIADNSDQLLSKFFDEAYMFIEEARRKKCNILIHCLAGISRSPTIAIAYLMRVRSLHWKDAYDLVKQCRPQIDPNLNFMGQLRIYNKSLKDEHSTVANKRNGSTNDLIIEE